MSIDPITLDKWQAVCDAATPEPWSTEAIFDGKHETEVCAEPTIDTGNPNMIGHFVDDSPEEKQAQRDAYFCAIARTALPLAITALAASEARVKTLTEALRSMSDAAEMLWTVLANVSGGDWEKQSPEWQGAAARWRDNYFTTLKEVGQ